MNFGPNYSASKFGIVGFTRSMRVSYVVGVMENVSCVCNRRGRG